MTKAHTRLARFGAACLLAVVSTGTAIAQAQPGGTLLILNKGDATVSVYDRATRSELKTLPTGVGPHEAAVSPDGKTAVVCDYGEQTPGRTLTVIDLPSLSVTKTIDLGEPCRPHGIVFEPNGEHVLVTAEVLGELLRVRLSDGAIVGRGKTTQAASHMVAAGTGDLAFVANIAPGTVSVVNAKTGELLKVIQTGAGAEGIDVSPDGREVWVSNRAADTLSVIDAETLEVIETIECGAFPIRVKCTPDGERVLVSCMNSGEVAVLDRKTRKEIGRVATSSGAMELFKEGQGSQPIGILIPGNGAQAYIALSNVDFVAVLDLETLTISGAFKTGTTPDGMAWSVVTPEGAD